MSNGWTGGQYSLYRALFGAYLMIHFASLLPWGTELFSDRGMLPDAAASPLLYLFPNVLALCDAPLFATGLLAAGVALAGLFALGVRDRLAALALWYLWACLFGRNPLISNPSLPFVGWLLIAHAFLPRAPIGSWDARGRTDPGAGWEMPGPVFAAAWIVMALAYSYSGYTKLASPSWLDGSALARILDNPLARPIAFRELLLALPPVALRLATGGALALELAFAPLALIRRARPLIWSAMLAMHVGLVVLIDFADLSVGMVLLHLFTFDPAWVRRVAPATPETIFYDGHCGLCHRVVRLLLSEDRNATLFRFAPLQSETFRRAVPAEQAASLPDSWVLQTDAGRVLTRSAALIHLADRLGGAWRALGIAGRAVPARLRDAIYDVVAAVRHRIFGTEVESCPRVSADLRARFLL
jgi:predicted DCC family thiol-disulfide oxidoreductase YuxK